MNDNIRKAVSIIFVHKDEIFYIKRQNYLKAFPGYTSFPGGKVDKEDHCEGLEETLLNTLYRETEEELGINVQSLLDNGQISSIKLIGQATSPDFNPHRFETYFYRIDTIEKPSFVVDTSEAMEYGWVKPEVILKDFEEGSRLIVGPVLRVYELLGSDINYSCFIDLNKKKVEEVPSVEFIKDIIQVMPLSNTIPPAERTNSFVIGDETKIILDPSPKNRVECDNYIKSLKNYIIEKIFITHHHKDHHQFTPEIAKSLNLPVYISRDSYTRIKDIYGDDYFENIQIFFSKEGDIIGKWLGQNIVVYEIPGHDEGHLGLAPTSMNWFIVGDLFQGVGTVVVGGVEGDMIKYMNSLQKVIQLKPECVIPSHGIPLGGVTILEKTYAHRQMREQQIWDLVKKGHDENEILSSLYFDIPEPILKYAMANIKSHIKKLHTEGKL